MMIMRSHAHSAFGALEIGTSAGRCAAVLAALALSTVPAAASEIELVRPPVEATPVSMPLVVEAHPGFDSFPAHLLTLHAPPALRSPAAALDLLAEADVIPLADARTLTGVLGLPALSPLEMEQPMRFYESDVLVKFRAPGGRSSFATVELIF